ncbi:dienelactone hydrolase family protein [Shimia sp. R9_3]|uniref:dienelactone hydrolase family protein n=1 Tax=Shimia sp. R9_3 TaxID=2821113 RepID=UPI001ADB4E16|nr:dienelactone hydrolase family protein [Shimia sp. R9_3]MBO9400126.1 dienelactone hydrolase family protein [Shimia sp. R9_3]
MPNWTDPPAFTFSHRLDNGHTATHDVYRRGEGPPILILQELPGIGVETYDLADRLIAAGFSVYLPHLFGRLGRANKLTTATNFLRLYCVRREFQIFWNGKQSPIAAWMRALCADISAREDGARLGVIGMCLTGSFVIPLMAEDAVQAAVASQPALPIKSTPPLHMSQEDIDAAKEKMMEKGPALAMRYKSDDLSKPAHICALKTAFGEHLDIKEYDNPDGVTGRQHSLLTLDYLPEAYDLTETYFKTRFGMA